MILKRRWWWLLVASIPLLYLPLRAQETPPAVPAATPAGQPVAEPAVAPAPSEEQVSADNNLSFPVDI